MQGGVIAIPRDGRESPRLRVPSENTSPARTLIQACLQHSCGLGSRGPPTNTKLSAAVPEQSLTQNPDLPPTSVEQ